MKTAPLAITFTLTAGVGACSGTLADSRSTAAEPIIQQAAEVEATAPATPAGLGDEIVALVEAQFYDARRAAEWARRHRGYAGSISELGVLATSTNELLRELETSHTAYYSRHDPKANQLLSIFRESPSDPHFAYDSIGAEFGWAEPGWFIVRTFPAGPAEAAGLRRGDLVLRVEDAAFEPGRAFAGRAGKSLRLVFKRDPTGPETLTSVTPRRVDPEREWADAQRAGSRIIEQAGKRIAYAWLWSCAGETPQQMLADFIGEDAARADALIVDFRDGWGGCSPDFVSLFDRQVPIIAALGRDGRPMEYVSSWRGPLVVLINPRSTSGKEMIAHALKRRGRAVLVGETTAGAVSFGQANRLSDGSALYVAVAAIRIDGETLEGVGVQPHVRVPDDFRFAQGGDPQLQRALQIAAERADGHRESNRQPAVQR